MCKTISSVKCELPRDRRNANVGWPGVTRPRPDYPDTLQTKHHNTTIARLTWLLLGLGLLPPAGGVGGPGRVVRCRARGGQREGRGGVTLH